MDLQFHLEAFQFIRKFMNIHPLMCEALISLPTGEETSGEVTIFLEASPEVSN